jgi:hypothetical protein
MANQTKGRRLAFSRKFPPSISSIICVWLQVILPVHKTSEDGTQRSETSAHKIKKAGNNPKE